MNGNNTTDFNKVFEDFIDKIEKKDERYDNSEVKKQRVEKGNIDNKKSSVKDYLGTKLEDFEQKIEHTKFYGRVRYDLNEQKQEIIFLLDDKLILQLSYEDFLINYNSSKIIKELYNKENVYTLLDFVARRCQVSMDTLHHRFRMNFDDFVKNYISYTEEKFGADKLVNLKRISRNLEEYFNCKKVKYNNKCQLSNITDIKYLEEHSLEISKYASAAKKVLKNFIEEFCEVSNNIESSERIRKSTFYKVYEAYLKQKKLLNYKLSPRELKIILLEEYSESFIRNNGIFYLKKIKFKKFQHKASEGKV